MDTQIIKNAERGEYSEFSEIVKKELLTRLSSDPVVRKYANDMENIASMKAKFADIVSPEE